MKFKNVGDSSSISRVQDKLKTISLCIGGKLSRKGLQSQF